MPAKKTSTKTTASKPTKKRKKKDPVRLLRGMKDILPEHQAYRDLVHKKLEEIARAYGYMRIDTPILEYASLFSRTLGDETDVVSKEMYEFEDKSGDMVTLRPEFTAAMARAYIEHGFLNRPQPVKLYTTGQLFRHDRPQAGRYRQFHQFDIEVMGGRAEIIDAEIISVAYHLLKELGLTTTVHINSIGTVDDRNQYIAELTAYLKANKRKLSEESKARVTKNPLRVLDSKDEQDREVIMEAPQIIDWLSDDSKDYFMTVLEYLDDIGIPYVLQPTLVRGLDYYNDIVFELFAEGEEDGSQSALGGGGRYDGLVEQLGGQPTPSAGFAIGIERLILAMKANEVSMPGLYVPDVFLAQLGKSAQKHSLKLMEELRTEGFSVTGNLVKGSLSAQLKMANKLGARFTLILGQKELLDGTIILRDMESGSQEMVDMSKVYKELGRRLQTPRTKPMKAIVGPRDRKLAEDMEMEDNVQLAAKSSTTNGKVKTTKVADSKESDKKPAKKAAKDTKAKKAAKKDDKKKPAAKKKAAKKK